MKKIFWTTLLFLLALTVVAAPDLTPLLKDRTYNLTYGIPLPKEPAINDLSNVTDVSGLTMASVKCSTEELDTGFGTIWYNIDFSEDPFDGTIEILNFGAPLPSAPMTLFVTICVVGIIYMCKSKSAKEEKPLSA